MIAGVLVTFAGVIIISAETNKELYGNYKKVDDKHMAEEGERLGGRGAEYDIELCEART